MARILAYTSPSRGDLYPIVPVLIELRARGHEVAVRTLSTAVPAMQELGFTAAPIAAEIEALRHDDYQVRTPDRRDQTIAGSVRPPRAVRAG